MSLDNFLLKYSRFIDDVDMFLGPASSLLNQYDDDFLLYTSSVIKCVDLGLKAPFLALYVSKTKDFSSVPYLFLKEAFALSVPYGGFIEVFRNYERVAKKNLKEK